MKRKTKTIATSFAILAAALYAVNIPFSKLLLTHVQPTMMAAFLYLGAGLGLIIHSLLRKEKEVRAPLTRADLPYIVGMVVLDIAAPILLMLGLQRTNSASASLINNFEIVATSLIAFFLFHEVLSRRLTVAIILITLSSAILGFDGRDSLQFNSGSLLVLAASCCWGLENNCTRMLSSKSSVQITTIKGIFSGFGSLIVAFATGETVPEFLWLLAVLGLGFISYGLSINFYINAQKDLGAAKTSAYYSITPFLGVVFSMVLLGERPAAQFYIGFGIMILATVLLIKDTISLQHTHEHIHRHTHTHRHGNLEHSHDHTHVHTHMHTHGTDSTIHSHSHKHLDDHQHSHM